MVMVRRFSSFWHHFDLVGFPGIYWRRHGGNGLKFCMLIYPDHPENWLDYGHSLLIFLRLASLWHSETGQICGFRAFWKEWPEMLILMYPDHLQNWLDNGHGLLIFLIWALFFFLVKWSNLSFLCISRRTHEMNSLKLCMLMYPGP